MHQKRPFETKCFFVAELNKDFRLDILFSNGFIDMIAEIYF
jgi:hypothetical protein